ncbi:Wall-associated receptor kinase [Parasponia andersonii]|uniref:non-specific serine/threonine protein kinase n=1 Tax=Parasponia andersonii TaxID=3476 RepID=A0A2P5BWF0_PARAD|nr:Wall-associated receptor kinase [Parasponia andersonii]
MLQPLSRQPAPRPQTPNSLLPNAISTLHSPLRSSAMHPIPLSLVTVAGVLSFSFFFFFSGHVKASGDTLSDCDRTFNCGPLKNITYPFTGGDRPDRCGPPEFRLACVNDSPELTINSVTHKVLELDPFLQTLSLARLDLWNETCPGDFVNTTLDSGVFSSGAGNADLTMFYRCNTSRLTMKPENQFKCGNYGSSFSDSYFLVGPIPFDPILAIIKCGESVEVPILEPMAAKLLQNRSLLGEALMMGFKVNYTIPNADDCSKCLDSGHQCGFDPKSNKSLCICGNRDCPVPGKKGKLPQSIGFSIAGACILGMFIGVFTYYFIQRKKKRAALAKSKELPTPPSSKSIVTPTTTFSRSTPSGSYTFTKSDLEKGSTYFGAQIFSYTELEEATDNFDPSRELGEGGFGTVYYGNLRDGRVVAVKRLYENNFKRVEQFMNEVEILTRLEHQNLVKLYGCTSRRSRELLLVYEFIPNGTVADHLHGKQSKSSVLSWPVRLSIAIETADALAYLHRSDIIHRDVKTNNILLDNEFRVKVADFGLSRLFPTDVTHVSTAPQGTPGYVDPEYYQCYQLTDKSDVYSFGVVLVELISSLQAVDTNRHRHDINLANMAINKIQNHVVNELVDPSLGFDKDYNIRRMTTAVAELAFRCLQQEKDMRPSMDEVVAALRAIQNEEFVVQKAEVVDIRSEVVDIRSDD